MRKPLISHERAVLLITYSPETGQFKWRASTSVAGRSVIIGRFDRIEDAEAAYQRTVLELFGEFARPERKAS